MRSSAATIVPAGGEAASNGAKAPASRPNLRVASSNTSRPMRSGCSEANNAASVPPSEWPTQERPRLVRFRGDDLEAGGQKLVGVLCQPAIPLARLGCAPRGEIDAQAGFQTAAHDADPRQEIPDVGLLDRRRDEQNGHGVRLVRSVVTAQPHAGSDVDAAPGRLAGAKT